MLLEMESLLANNELDSSLAVFQQSLILCSILQCVHEQQSNASENTIFAAVSTCLLNARNSVIARANRKMRWCSAKLR